MKDDLPRIFPRPLHPFPCIFRSPRIVHGWGDEMLSLTSGGECPLVRPSFLMCGVSADADAWTQATTDCNSMPQ